MNITVLFWSLMVGEIALLIFFLIFWLKARREEEEAALAKGAEESQILVLETQLNYLRTELDKTETNYKTAQNEIQELKKRRDELNSELIKQKESYRVDDKELERLKKESAEFKSRSQTLEGEVAKKEERIMELISRSQAIEKELAKREERIKVLEKESQEVVTQSSSLVSQSQAIEKEIAQKNERIKELTSQIEKLEKEKKTQLKIIEQYKKKGELPAVPIEEEIKVPSQLEIAREEKKQKIGEILLANKFISREILNKALEYQQQAGGSLTQYLLAYGYIDEGQLAQCLCTQFGIPYLPLASYTIPPEIIKLIPIDIAEKYWLIPVDKVGNVLTIVMADPLDTKASKEVEEITGCKVLVFLGLLSEIIEALQDYYQVIIEEKGIKTKRKLPFFIDTKTYKGPERRQSIRFKSKIEVNFTEQGKYKISKTRDVSRDGFSFESDSALSMGSVVTLQINLPKEYSPLPIAVVVQVMRVVPLENNKFEIGVKIIKISEQELNAIISYASTHKEE